MKQKGDQIVAKASTYVLFAYDSASYNARYLVTKLP